MDTKTRAHRILAAIANYKTADAKDGRLATLVEGRLGEPVGSYRNPESESEIIDIFADGLVWYGDVGLIELRFADIAEVVLAHGKESEGLLLTMKDGTQQPLPVRGHRGRFFDSTEMLRFLDRVMSDLRTEAL